MHALNHTIYPHMPKKSMTTHTDYATKMCDCNAGYSLKSGAAPLHFTQNSFDVVEGMYIHVINKMTLMLGVK